VVPCHKILVGELTNRAAIFDGDGTLVDSVDLHAEFWHKAFLRFAYDIPTDVETHTDRQGRRQTGTIFLPVKDMSEKGKAIEKLRRELFQKEYLPRVDAFRKVRELFETITPDGQKVALASSFKQDQLKQLKHIA